MSPPTSVDRIFSRHPAVFEGIGKLIGYQLLVQTDPSVEPVAQLLRRTHFHMQKDYEKKLKELQDYDISEDVDGPTPWVSPPGLQSQSPMVISECVWTCVVSTMPTLEETLQDLNWATVFSKLDIRWGCYQVELHPESRVLTIFSTHMGLKWYKRLIFGLSSTSKIYQSCKAFPVYAISQTIS